jgi:hypothetical protein
MMSGVPLETCWAVNECWNNIFRYKVASCWLFILRYDLVFFRKNETNLNTFRGDGQSCKKKCSVDDPKCNKGDLRPRRTSTSGMWSGLRMNINTFPNIFRQVLSVTSLQVYWWVDVLSSDHTFPESDRLGCTCWHLMTHFRNLQES